MTGHVLGTPGYMSPEQARGEAVNQRTDIWAFGCLLYELLAGRRAFPSGSPAEAMSAVLHREPDWDSLPPGVPDEVRRLLRQCLEKESDRRPLNIAEVRPRPGAPGAFSQSPLT